MSPLRTPLSTRRFGTLAWLLIPALFLAMLAVPWTFAQEATPPAATGAAEGTAAPTEALGTPTPTHTPTVTPTPTATLTGLESKLVLAQAYLEGKDYDQAATLFAEVAEEDRGNPQALAGLKAALEGRAAAMATLSAPWPTAVPTPAPTQAPVTFGDTFGANLREFAGVALAGLLLVVLVYLLAHAVRWLLFGLRELWLLHGLPIFRRPAVRPGYLIGQFANGLGDAAPNASQVVTSALTEKLLAWNHLVRHAEAPVEPAPSLDLGGMGWLKVLWSWVLPPSRDFEVTGALLQTGPSDYRLNVQRTALSRNSIDRAAAFQESAPTADAAFASMAGEAAKWLVVPDEIEAGQAVASGVAAAQAAGGPKVLTASELFDQALDLLLPVRQQVDQGAIHFSDARQRLQKAEGLLGQLPENSRLRRDLAAAVADLRRSVPSG